MLGFKVLKGLTLEKAEIDSTWSDRSKANARKATLKKSLRGNKICVWVIPMTEDDPKNYHTPKRSRY